MNVGKIISRAMHRNLTTPSVKCPRNVDLSSAVFPPKDRRYGIIIEPIFNGRIRVDGVLMLGASAITGDTYTLIRIRHVHARVATRSLHGTIKVGRVGASLWGRRWHVTARRINSSLAATLLMIWRHTPGMSRSVDRLLIPHGGDRNRTSLFEEK